MAYTGDLKKQTEKLLTAKQVAKMLAVSLRCFRNLRKNRRLPKAIEITERTVRWRKVDIQLWLDWGCPNEDKFEIRKDGFFDNPDCNAIRRCCSN